MIIRTELTGITEDGFTEIFNSNKILKEEDECIYDSYYCNDAFMLNGKDCIVTDGIDGLTANIGRENGEAIFDRLCYYYYYLSFTNGDISIQAN